MDSDQSLFGSDDDSTGELEETSSPSEVASVSVPSELREAGLYIFRGAIPETLQRELVQQISERHHFSPADGRDQVMLWGQEAENIVEPVLNKLGSLELEQQIHAAFFNSDDPLQVILNAYTPGSGIADHVDLPNRYGPVVIGISLFSSAAMRFRKLGSMPPTEHSVLLRPGDVYVLSESARWNWTHGIVARQVDKVSYRPRRPLR